MTIPTPTVSLSNNPGTGVFGNGLFQVFGVSGTFTVPFGISRVRVRVWGAGGSTNGATSSGLGGAGGGGFAMKAVDVSSGPTVAVTVGVGVVSTAGGTSSFGSFVSATGGSSTSSATGGAGGTGVGGDINYAGGTGGTGDGSTTNGGSGGAAGVFGNGGNGATSGAVIGSSGNSGGGNYSSNSPAAPGFFKLPTTIVPSTSLDFIATGAGGITITPPTNGGGGCGSNATAQVGALPGGGTSYSGFGGANGLVIVEY